MSCDHRDQVAHAHLLHHVTLLLLGLFGHFSQGHYIAHKRRSQPKTTSDSPSFERFDLGIGLTQVVFLEVRQKLSSSLIIST